MEDQLTLENEKQPLKTRLQNQINDDGPTVTDVAKSMGFEVSANLATDFATGWLAPVAPLYAAINFASGLGANLIAQKIRGEKGFKFGEALASGGLATIPLMDPTLGRTATKLVGNPWSIQRAVVGGAGLGIAQRQLEAGIDEQRLISPTEAALSFGVGGAGGAGGKVIGDALGRKLINVIKGKPIDPYDPVNWTGKGTVGAKKTTINNDPIDNDYWLSKTQKLAENLARRRGLNFETSLENARNTLSADMTQVQKLKKVFMRTGQKDLINLTPKWSLLKQQSKDTRRLLSASYFTLPNLQVDPEETSSYAIKGIRETYAPLVNNNILRSTDFNLHHEVPLISALPGAEGVRWASPEWWDIMRIFYARGLRPGHTGVNLTELVGQRSPSLGGTFPTPHSIAHKFLESKTGPDGTLFWTRKRRNKMLKDHSYRKKLWNKYADLIVDSKRITEIATQTFVDLYARNPALKNIRPDPKRIEEVIDRLIEYTDEGLTKGLSEEFQVNQMKQIAAIAAADLSEPGYKELRRAIINEGSISREILNKYEKLKRFNEMDPGYFDKLDKTYIEYE